MHEDGKVSIHDFGKESTMDIVVLQLRGFCSETCLTWGAILHASFSGTQAYM